MLMILYTALLLSINIRIINYRRKKLVIPNFMFCFRIKDQVTTIYPADVVLFEGILVFYFSNIRDLFHMKLFVDTDSDTRLARRGMKIFSLVFSRSSSIL